MVKIKASLHLLGASKLTINDAITSSIEVTLPRKHYKWNGYSAYSGYKWTKTITIFFYEDCRNFSLRNSARNAH